MPSAAQFAAAACALGRFHRPPWSSRVSIGLRRVSLTQSELLDLFDEFCPDLVLGSEKPPDGVHLIVVVDLLISGIEALQF